ncbi:MAG: M56 family metallopeptidase, partial [Acutalibacteraceae bacterium]
FVLGIIKPKIYLPFNVEDQDIEHIIAHEQAHIKRKDHWWKPLGFLLLAIHWFNPLMWLSYVLLCRDIELACDEKVVRELNNEQRTDYSQALLTCSVNRRMITACPLAFGAVGVKTRVKSVLNYKKPAFWIIAVAVIASIVLAVCFLTNPYSGKDINDRMKITIDMAIANENYSEHYDGQFSTCAYDIFETKKSFSETTVYALVLYEEFKLENGNINIVSGSSGPVVLTVDTSDRGESTTYYVKEYWTPRDGSYYSNDIKEKFPKKMWSKVFNVSENIDSLEKQCLRSAQEYFDGMTNTPPETLKDIEGFKLDSIATSAKSVLIAGIDTYSRQGRIGSNLLQELADLKISVSPVANDSDEERFAYNTLVLQTEQEVRQTSYQSLPGIYIHFDCDFTEVWIRTIWNKSCVYSVNDPQAAELIYSRITNYVSKISEQSTSSKLIYDRILYGNKNGKITSFSDEYRSARPENFDLASEAIRHDEIHAVVTDATINAIKASYPMFFDLPTESGLVVYIYQMAQCSYSCILVPGKPEDYDRWELCDTTSVGIAEMRIIIHCYLSSGVSKDNIVICAMQNPLSSHCYNIDEAYCKNLSTLFWSDFPPVEATNISSDLESTSFNKAIDTASFDIDGDGKEEKCILYNAIHSDRLSFGTYTFIMSAYEDGELKYFNMFSTRHIKMNFQQDKNGKTTLSVIDFNNEQFTIDIAVKDGNIALNNDNLHISYWGKQGVDSPFAVKYSKDT